MVVPANSGVFTQRAGFSLVDLALMDLGLMEMALIGVTLIGVALIEIERADIARAGAKHHALVLKLAHPGNISALDLRNNFFIVPQG